MNCEITSVVTGALEQCSFGFSRGPILQAFIKSAVYASTRQVRLGPSSCSTGCREV